MKEEESARGSVWLRDDEIWNGIIVKVVHKRESFSKFRARLRRW
jgi:hypothetical protein